MNDEQMNTIQIQASCMRKHWSDRKNKAYADLIELAELDDSEMCDDEAKNADLAMSTVQRYGSIADKSTALGLYIVYLNTKTLLGG